MDTEKYIQYISEKYGAVPFELKYEEEYIKKYFEKLKREKQNKNEKCSYFDIRGPRKIGIYCEI